MSGERAVVVLLDDQREVQRVTAAALRRFGYDVLTPKDAEAALAIVASDAPVDLLLADVLLASRMSGLDLAIAARAHRPQLPVLLSSGGGKEIASLIAEADRGFEFLEKPYNASTLAGRVAAIIGRPGLAR